MKYNNVTLNNAIYLLEPNFGMAVDKGVDMNVPGMLKSVAVQFFVNSLDETWNPSFNERTAYFVCQEALLDLKEHGWFLFGDKSYDFYIKD